MSKEKPPSFQFYPRDFQSDPVVELMTLAECGAYIRLLCVAWQMDEAGVLPNDDEKLARWSRAGGQWPDVREGVLRAFQLVDGKLVQKRMVEVRGEQKFQYERARAGGLRRGGAKRDAGGRWEPDAQPTASPHPASSWIQAPPPASASASALEEEPNTLVPSLCSETPVCESGKRTKKRTRSLQEKEPQGFTEFYAAYPRHEGRRAAAKQFALALKRRPEYTASDLKLAAEQFAQKSVGTEERFICLPATWLSQDRWREYFDEEEKS